MLVIRSQDRRTLVKTDCVFCNKNNNITCLKENVPAHLGTYETRERALEILDMIQDAIEDGTSCHEKALIDKYGTTQEWKRHYVFEMPKE